MGGIVYWTLIRLALTIVAVIYLSDFYTGKFWWPMVLLAIYLIVIHPAISQYKQFIRKNSPIIEDTLCSNCKHFDETAVLCMKHDEHPSQDYIPCEGMHWEPK